MQSGDDKVDLAIVPSETDTRSDAKIAAYLRLDQRGALGKAVGERSAEHWTDLLVSPLNATRPKAARRLSSNLAARQEDNNASLVGAPEAARICGISRTTW